MRTTKVYSDLLDAYLRPEIRIIRLRGSTRSSKTYSTIQLLNQVAMWTKKPKLISIVSETMPHLKRGAIRDFENMLKTESLWNESAWHDTDKMYSYENGQLEFFSVDSYDKVLGPARDILYINEAINNEYEVYRQLSVRTKEKVIIDDNPAFEYWADTKLAHRDDYVCIDSTYLDNDLLTESQVREIESNRDTDPEWWAVYGLGQQGSRAGVVMRKWDTRALPPKSEWKDAWIGVDFGWAAPSAVMLVVLSQGDVWIDQLAYGPGMDNPEIARTIHDAGYSKLEVICDAAEPKSIAELKKMKIKAVKSDNKDIELGLAVMNRYEKHYTPRSLDSIQENRMYRYPKLPNGDYGTLPIKKYCHAKDAERYVFLNRLSQALPKGWSVTSSQRGKKSN